MVVRALGEREAIARIWEPTPVEAAVPTSLDGPLVDRSQQAVNTAAPAPLLENGRPEPLVRRNTCRSSIRE